MGKKRIWSDEEIKDICNLYINEMPSTHKLAKKFKTTHKTISNILKENNISIRKRGGQLKYGRKGALERYRDKIRLKATQATKQWIAVCKDSGKEFYDYLNKSGALSKHIGIKYSTYAAKVYFQKTGKRWYEEYFDLIEVDIAKTKQCEHCEWTTKDVNNKTGAYTKHLLTAHNIKKEKHYKKDEYVVCQICGQKMKIITQTHLKTHNTTPHEYKLKYEGNLMSPKTLNLTTQRLDGYRKEGLTTKYESSDEKELRDYIESLGFVAKKNNSILNGHELDMVIESEKIAIEFNGNFWHTEQYGKNKNYHLTKTKMCNEKGYQLIHIFEDEWNLNKELVKKKLKHILGKNNSQKIYARKCIVKEITTHDKNEFLQKYHIQSNDNSNIKLGLFFNDELISVMTFLITDTTFYKWKLNRFASNDEYVVIGGASKLLNYFIKNFKFTSITTFADRRWTLNKNNNLYTKIGFKLVDELKPNYTYFNSKIDRYKRINKMSFKKKNILKKYPYLNENLTELELATELGYSRIWDCGLFKYELT